MDREEIIRMARESVRLPKPQTPQEEAIERALAPIFERFAALVAAHEREECAKACDEREEIFQKYYTKGLPALCAAAIRARGEK